MMIKFFKVFVVGVFLVNVLSFVEVKEINLVDGLVVVIILENE